jgi:hypothetical protein
MSEITQGTIAWLRAQWPPELSDGCVTAPRMSRQTWTALLDAAERGLGKSQPVLDDPVGDFIAGAMEE